MSDDHNFVEVEWIGTQEEYDDFSKSIWEDVTEFLDMAKAQDINKPVYSKPSQGAAKVPEGRKYSPKYYERVMGPNGWVYKYRDNNSGTIKTKRNLAAGDAVKVNGGHIVVNKITGKNTAHIEHHVVHPTTGQHISKKTYKNFDLNKVSDLGRKRKSGLKSKYL